MAVETRTTAAMPPEETAELDVPLTLGPNGPAMAAMLAAALGVFALGLITTLAAAGEGVKEWLIFQERVGPLSGKTTMAGVGWLVIWAVLHVAWRKKDVPFAPVIGLMIVLFIAGNLLMMPTIFQQFEP